MFSRHFHFYFTSALDNIFQLRIISSEQIINLIRIATMEIKLESSNLEKVRIVEETLFVWFKNGKVYRYEEVPYSVSIGLANAEKAGAYLQQEIKGNYRYSTVTEDDVIECANEELTRLRSFADSSNGLWCTDKPQSMKHDPHNESFQINFKKAGKL